MPSDTSSVGSPPAHQADMTKPAAEPKRVAAVYNPVYDTMSHEELLKAMKEQGIEIPDYQGESFDTDEDILYSQKPQDRSYPEIFNITIYTNEDILYSQKSQVCASRSAN
ncbi:hypothetical protein FQN53_008538 [Emmonsiellopsis sp. PD_33]|nr:hypothetical protein FQN53_008538 [Emmonsiellopsis sp. PD_33]